MPGYYRGFLLETIDARKYIYPYKAGAKKFSHFLISLIILELVGLFRIPSESWRHLYFFENKIRVNGFKICGVINSCDGESINQGRSYDNVDIDVSECSFSRNALFSGKGGVIYVSEGSYSIGVSYSMFANCLASGGGAIFFSSTNVSLRMVCAYMCSVSGDGHFADLLASNKNQVEYLSISYCSTSTGYYSIRLKYANPRFDNSNSSMNKAIQVSSIGIEESLSFSSSYCTFCNNRGTICIFLGSNTGTVIFANVIDNYSNMLAIIYVDGLQQIKYSIFDLNQKALLWMNSGSLILSHSFVYHSSFSSTGTNNSLTKKQTYQFVFFKSHYCNAEIPAPAPSPKPSRTMMQSIVNSPKETLMESPIETLIESPIETLIESPIETLMKSPVDTLMESPKETLMESPIETLMDTYEMTIRDTQRITIKNTQK